jgi:hypothetical protein
VKRFHSLEHDPEKWKRQTRKRGSIMLKQEMKSARVGVQAGIRAVVLGAPQKKKNRPKT